MKKWYKLDAFARTYSSIIGEGRTTCFRLSATLYEKIERADLIKAANNLLERYDFFNVELKKGLFWNYLQQKNTNFSVSKESTYPCTYVKKSSPLRILYYKNRISIEVAHFLSDGVGSLDFLRDLIKEYLNIKYKLETQNKKKEKVLGYENLYEKYYKKVSKETTVKKAFHLPYKREKGAYFITSGEIDLKSLKEKAKAHNTSIGKYLLAVYFKVFSDNFSSKKGNKGNVVIGVPVDLRRIFDDYTNRNFFINITPSIDLSLGEYDLESIIKYLNSYFDIKINKKEFYKSIYKAVSPSHNKFIGIVPYFIKSLFLPFIFDYYGERGYTSGFSNLGVFEIEESYSGYIQRVEMTPPPSKRCITKVGMIGFGDKVCVTFGNLSANTDLEKFYFSYLRKNGIISKIITNY